MGAGHSIVDDAAADFGGHLIVMPDVSAVVVHGFLQSEVPASVSGGWQFRKFVKWHSDGYDSPLIKEGMQQMRYLLGITILFFITACSALGVIPGGHNTYATSKEGLNVGSHLLVLSNAFPITVVAAIILFVVKEIVEFVKKTREKARKIAAYKALIAEELLKNAWSLKALKRLCFELQEPTLREIEYKKSASGTERVIVRTEEGVHETFFWKIHTAAFEKIMTDLAVSHSKLFKSAAEVYSLLAEVKHVRESIIDFAEFEMPKHMIKGLGDYGNNTLEEASAAVKSAYKTYTGEELVGHKLRSYL